MEIKKLNKYPLTFNETLDYFKENLKDVNELSMQILNLIDFSLGSFYTLLPQNANFEKIYNFNEGNILPQNFEEETINGHTFMWITDIDYHLTQMIIRTLEKDTSISCVIDKFEGYPKEKYEMYYKDDYSLFYCDEIYFRIESDNCSENLIKNCLKKSNTFWHSLLLLTKEKLHRNSKNLNLEIIKSICLKTELVMVCAYDGEGYVFWERKDVNCGNGYF